MAPTPVFSPGEPCGQRSLVGCCPWGRTESDTTEATQHASMHWRRNWQPIPVFLPRESQGQRSLVGCRRWGRTESDMTEATLQQQQISIGLGTQNWVLTMVLSQTSHTTFNRMWSHRILKFYEALRGLSLISLKPNPTFYFHICRNWGLEIWYNLLQVTWLANGIAGSYTQGQLQQWPFHHPLLSVSIPQLTMGRMRITDENQWANAAVRRWETENSIQMRGY